MISTYVTEGRLSVNYPRLMRGVNNRQLVVLFSDENQGAVLTVAHDEEIYAVGDFYNSWDPQSFEVFDGEISLCNDQDVAGFDGMDEDGDKDDTDEYCGMCHQDGWGFGKPEAANKNGDIFINGKVIESNTALYAELMKTLSVKPAR